MKRYEEISNIIKNIRNHKKIKDMSSILNSFEEFTRAHAKAQPVIMKEENGVMPKFIVRALCELEIFINEAWEDKAGRKNMSKNNGKAMGTLRQKFRKYIKDFDQDLKKFRENPDQGDDFDDEEEKVPEEKVDSESESEAPTKADFFKKDVKAPKVAKTKVVKDDESDDSMDWGSSSDEDSDADEDEVQAGGNMRDQFIKRVEKEKLEGDTEEKVQKRVKGECKYFLNSNFNL